MPYNNAAELQERLQYHFKQLDLLLLALTHSSYLNETQDVSECNERLEFLGDAVLELTISEELYKRFPDEREGPLTRLRSKLVKEPSLAALARTIDLPDHLLLGRGEESQGGRERDALLADAMEAVIGAVFVDGGFSKARACVKRLLKGRWPDSPELPRTKDYKTWLQELTQRTSSERPVYAQTEVHGPDHAKIYVVEVRLPDNRRFTAEGGSKKKAEQNAARKALVALGENHACE